MVLWAVPALLALGYVLTGAWIGLEVAQTAADAQAVMGAGTPCAEDAPERTAGRKSSAAEVAFPPASGTQAAALGESVEALMAVVDCQALALHARNKAVWALGQLGDRRALELLQRHYTGEPCDHRHRLCQRELSKAIALVEGGPNLTAPVWRNDTFLRLVRAATSQGLWGAGEGLRRPSADGTGR